MPFWTQRPVYVNGQLVQGWKSESCYFICYSQNNVLIATKKNVASFWGRQVPQPPQDIIRNNPTQNVFPGGSHSQAAQPQDLNPQGPALGDEVLQIACTEFFEETGLRVDDQNDIWNGNNKVGVRQTRNIVHPGDQQTGFYHAVLVEYSDNHLDAIRVAINANIGNDGVIVGNGPPLNANNLARVDDELASVVIRPRLAANANWNIANYFLDMPQNVQQQLQAAAQQHGFNGQLFFGLDWFRTIAGLL